AAETSTALAGVPRASVAASAPGKRPSCASTNGMREYTSSSALNSANALTIPATASQRPSHGPTTRVARSGHAPSVHAVHGVSASTGITETRYTAVTRGSARASARGYVVVACSISPPIVEPGPAPDQRQRHEPGFELRQPRCEEAQVLNEQHRVDRHVEQRIGPGEPTVPEPPEAAERPLDPLVVATLDGQHRGQLADEQRFGNTVDEGRRDQQQQRDAGAHRADQPLQTERPARHGEEHHRHEGP